MKNILGFLIIIVFTCLMFTLIEIKWFYLIYGSVIFYCIITLNENREL